MTNPKQKLTLDRPATYKIQVPGALDERWPDWEGEITIAVENDQDGMSISTLTASLDQAALQGLLRRLYSLGIPLISVICVDFARE